MAARGAPIRPVYGRVERAKKRRGVKFCNFPPSISLLRIRPCAAPIRGFPPRRLFDYEPPIFANDMPDREVLVRTHTARSSIDVPDFEQVFQKMPGLCLVLDTGFIIVAQNQEHARETKIDAVGQLVFAAFPDNPGHAGAAGVARIRESLLKVLKTRETDHLPMLRYDVKPPGQPFETRNWAVTNIPILGDDGYVRWILLRAEEMTELVEQRHNVGLSADGRVAPS